MVSDFEIVILNMLDRLEVFVSDFCSFPMQLKKKPWVSCVERPVLMCTPVAAPTSRRSKVLLWFLSRPCIHLTFKIQNQTVQSYQLGLTPLSGTYHLSSVKKGSVLGQRGISCYPCGLVHTLTWKQLLCCSASHERKK